MELDLSLEAVKAELERAYERLRSVQTGDDTDRILQEIEKLERELLVRYSAALAKRDSSIPPKR